VPILVEGEEEAHDSARDFDVGTARVFVSSKGDGEALMESIPGEWVVSTAAVSTVIVGALGRLAGASESMIAD
jgi:hypothetical protein